METKMMKKTKISLWKWALGICMLFAGVQNSFAMTCDGNIYVQGPSTWDKVTIVAGGVFVELTKGTSGWYEGKAAAIGQGNTFRVNSTGEHYPAQWIDRNHYDIANNGSTDTDAFTCDDLTSGTLYIYEDPTEPGKTIYGTNPPNAKYLFVMIPPDFEDWMSSVPMLSLDGGKTGKPMQAVPDMCGWYSYVFFNETITDNVFLYRDDDEFREDMIGANGNWEQHPESPEPIAMNMMFGDDNDSLFFVPDEEQKQNEDGFYYTKAEVEDYEGTCSYPLAALIYDTDASVNPLFSCWKDGADKNNDGCQKSAESQNAIYSCLGVQPGLVESTLDPVTKKPKMSEDGKKCFINEIYFNQLFNYVPNVNERRCYEMPFTRATDGKWEFDSDFYKSPGVNGTGGFYPVENDDDGAVLADDPNQKLTPAVRTKRDAQGPVFYGPEFREIDPDEKATKLDILCDGPGWTGGENCEGAFNTGSEAEMAFAVEFVGGSTTGDQKTCVLGWSCDQMAPSDWHFFKPGTDTEVPRSTKGADYRWAAQRNQHYCFESHAKFTFKKGLRFSFRGDDDIWVFIDNRLAVDLGGTHLAAPGYVDLDYFFKDTDVQPGDEKDLDIFFCDRRTTMSNVRIKTNMYIQQKKSITSKETKTAGNKDESSFSLCYVQTGDGSCVSALAGGGQSENVELCGAQMQGLDIRYFVVNGYRATDPVMTDPATGADTISVAGSYFGGGLDLSTLYAPKIDTKKFTPPPGKGGTFALYVTIGGKNKRLKKWRTTGEVDVVYADAKSYTLDSLDNQIPDQNGNYVLEKSAMGGKLVPVYVSAVTPTASDNSKLDIIRPDAVGISYTLEYTRGMVIYTKNAAGEYQELPSGTSRQIDNTGIDTVYATVPMELLQGSSDFEISVKNRANKRKIKFYMPKIYFVDKPAADWNQISGDKPENGVYEEHWVGSYVSFYMVVVKPSDNGGYDLCEDCDLSITAGVDAYNRNEKIELSPDTIWFENGFASFSVRAQKAYRYDADPTMNNPAVIAVNGLINGRINDYIRAEYTPIYFREPPVPYPVLADVFDVEGAEPAVDYNMPSKFKSDKYLDGIGDSVVIYYDRRIHRDSLPTYMCILWDSLSAKSYFPAIEGWSNSAKDSVNAVLCNEVKDQSAFKCLGTPDAANYCDPYVTLSGLTLSSDVKTSGVGHVYSYAKFIDKCVDRNGVLKCDTVKAGFDGEIVDRIAPVPMSAVVRTLMNGDELGEFDSLVVMMSEPVKLLETVTTGKNRALDFYLNSAIEYDELNRYASALGNSSILVEARGEPVVSVTADNKGRIKYLYSRGGLSPHVGDYARLGGDLSLPLWSDTTDYHRALLKGDSIRAAINAVDAAYFWNSPTGYAETTRLPSRWVLVTGDAEIAVIETNFGYTGMISPDSTEPVTVHGYRTTLTPDEVRAIEGRPGHFVKADMFSLINGLSEAELQALDTNDVYFEYAVEYFTNLGSYVASKKGKIYCNDELNPVWYFTQPGAAKPGKCTDAGMERNFFIGWNMLANNGRTVGTGAYIVKLKSFVKMGGYGKKAKQEKTSVWGAKRGLPKGADLMGVLNQILH